MPQITNKQLFPEERTHVESGEISTPLSEAEKANHMEKVALASIFFKAPFISLFLRL